MASPISHTHAQFRPSKCNFLTRRGLHENYVMSRTLIPPDFFFVHVLLRSRWPGTEKVSGSRGPPLQNREKKIERWLKMGFWGHFSIFRLFFPYFPGRGEPETSFFLMFRAGGPKPILYHANAIANVMLFSRTS